MRVAELALGLFFLIDFASRDAIVELRWFWLWPWGVFRSMLFGPLARLDLIGYVLIFMA